MRKQLFKSVRAFVYMFCACLGCLLSGCATPTKPLFREPDPTLHWPASPTSARILYLGSLHSDADLHAAKGVFEAIGEFLVGPKKPQSLYGPRMAVATRDGQRVWIADPGGRCLQLFDLERRKALRLHTLGGAPLLSPVGLSLGPDDSLFVCDSQSGAIHKISARDGSHMDTLQGPEDLLRPVALYYDEHANELWVVDALGHDLKVLAPDGSLRRIVGHRGTGPGEFNFPCAITATDHAVWIADTGNHRVQAITRGGTPITSFGRAGDAPGDLALPKGIALDSDEHVYVVDGRFENVQIFNAAGELLLFFGEEGTAPGEFWLPSGVFMEPTGRIWVCDTYNQRVQVFQYVRDEQAAKRGVPAN